MNGYTNSQKVLPPFTRQTMAQAYGQPATFLEEEVESSDTQNQGDSSEDDAEAFAANAFGRCSRYIDG